MTDDIFDLVHEDEASFDLEIWGRKDGEPVNTGVVFSVRDLGNADSQKALKAERNKSIGKRLRLKGEMPDEDLGAMWLTQTSEPTDEMLAHCVTGWEWGGKKLGKFKLAYGYDNVLAVIKGVPWIRAQVLAKVLEISGFTKA